MVAFSTAVFLKVVSAAVAGQSERSVSEEEGLHFKRFPFAAVATVIAVILGGIHFAVGGRNNSLHLRMGVMYYVQVRRQGREGRREELLPHESPFPDHPNLRGRAAGHPIVPELAQESPVPALHGAKRPDAGNAVPVSQCEESLLRLLKFVLKHNQ